MQESPCFSRGENVKDYGNAFATTDIFVNHRTEASSVQCSTEDQLFSFKQAALDK
jgi:hypothetical protein